VIIALLEEVAITVGFSHDTPKQPDIRAVA
jgi:hypothetical protein